MLDCDRALELISARIDREISPFDDDTLNTHLTTCAACREELEGVRRLDEFVVRSFTPEREAADILVDKVKASLQARGRSVRRCSVLIVDNEPSVVLFLHRALGEEFEVLTAMTAPAAREWFSRREIDIILADQSLLGQQESDLTGVELLEWVLANHPRTQRLLMTGHGRFEGAVEAINRGYVFRYLRKPDDLHPDSVLNDLRGAARLLQLERGNERVLRELSELNVRLEERVRQRTRELEEVNRELEQRTHTLEKFALTDALTQLPNRLALDFLLERELRGRERGSLPLMLAMIDVDLFKEINTKYLHPGGDHVLRELAKCMTTTLRKLDVLGRVSGGGDEFVLIAPRTPRAGGKVLTERLRAQVEGHPFLYKGQRIPVTVTIGLAVLEAGRLAHSDQIKLAAAAALKRAKDNGRNCVEIEVVGLLPAEAKPGLGPGVASA